MENKPIYLDENRVQKFNILTKYEERPVNLRVAWIVDQMMDWCIEEYEAVHGEIKPEESSG